MRVLLVEDDKKTAAFIARGLREADFTVEHAADGPSGLELASCTPFDAAIVDIMLPGMDGLTLIGELRHRNLTLPVLVLSAKRSVDDRVRGLQAGGDDYLVKPFAFTELLARIRALIRRAASAAEPRSLRVRDLTVDLYRRKVFRGATEIDLQPKEFALLQYLAANAGRVVSRTMIMEHVWEYNFDPRTNVVDVRVCRLRYKIDRPFGDPLIHTVRGVGYVLE